MTKRIGLLATGAVLALVVGTGPGAAETLRLLTWSNYAPDEVIAKFEEENPDITVEVTYSSNEDMIAKLRATGGAGFDLAGYCSQASFLLGNGIDRLLADAEERTDEAGAMRLRQELKRLTLPAQMGERFQAMAFARDIDLGAAFLLGDLSWRL